MSASLAHSPRPLAIGTPASSALGMLLRRWQPCHKGSGSVGTCAISCPSMMPRCTTSAYPRGAIEHAVRHGRRETPSCSASASSIDPRTSVLASSWAEWRVAHPVIRLSKEILLMPFVRIIYAGEALAAEQVLHLHDEVTNLMSSVSVKRPS